MTLRPLLLVLAIAAPFAAGCSTNVPEGFDSGTSLATRDVVADTETVYAAAIDVLRERGDSVEEEKRDVGGVLRTGRFRIVVEPRPGGATHIDVFVMRYVGTDHQGIADETLAKILARLD